MQSILLQGQAGKTNQQEAVRSTTYFCQTKGSLLYIEHLSLNHI